jgi:hypothetical protein
MFQEKAIPKWKAGCPLIASIRSLSSSNNSIIMPKNSNLESKIELNQGFVEIWVVFPTT